MYASAFRRLILFLWLYIQFIIFAITQTFMQIFKKYKIYKGNEILLSKCLYAKAVKTQPKNWPGLDASHCYIFTNKTTSNKKWVAWMLLKILARGCNFIKKSCFKLVFLQIRNSNMVVNNLNVCALKVCIHSVFLFLHT